MPDAPVNAVKSAQLATVTIASPPGKPAEERLGQAHEALRGVAFAEHVAREREERQRRQDRRVRDAVELDRHHREVDAARGESGQRARCDHREERRPQQRECDEEHGYAGHGRSRAASRASLLGREERIARRDEREPEREGRAPPPTRARGRTRPRRPRARTARIATAWKASTPQTPLAKSEVAAPTPSWTRGGRKRETASMVMCSFARLAATAPSTPTHSTRSRVSGSPQAQAHVQLAQRDLAEGEGDEQREQDDERRVLEAGEHAGGPREPGKARAWAGQRPPAAALPLARKSRRWPSSVCRRPGVYSPLRPISVRASAARRSSSRRSSGPGVTNWMP